MYIDPFAVGVMTTLLVELIIIIIAAVASWNKSGKK